MKEKAGAVAAVKDRSSSPSRRIMGRSIAASLRNSRRYMIRYKDQN
jgi:hypothetical protein